MSDQRNFRRSDNIEDRRKQRGYRPEPGGFHQDEVEPLDDSPLARALGSGNLDEDMRKADEAAKAAQKGGIDPNWSTFEDSAGDDPNGPPKRLRRAGSAEPQSFMARDTSQQQQAIVQAARENGIDPTAALAIAERESNFDPRARSSKTIAGMFQMRGDLRHQYGVGDSTDPYEQAAGWGKFFNQNKGEMSRVLGRTPTDAEGYLGHHFGSTRAAKMLQMDPATPVSHVFSDYERSINPHFDKAGTVGALNSSVMSDIGRRQARYGGASNGTEKVNTPDFAEFGDPVGGQKASTPGSKPVDLAEFGEIASYDGPKPPSATAATSAPDFSSFGTPA